MEAIYDVLELAILLLGKFWFVIAAYLGYKLLGNRGKKSAKGVSQGQPRAVVRTIGHSGAQAQEPVTLSAAVHERQTEPVEDGQSAFLPAWESSSTAENAPDSAASHSNEPLGDPREGMKWALIFGPPRSKNPHASSFPARRRNG